MPSSLRVRLRSLGTSVVALLAVAAGAALPAHAAEPAGAATQPARAAAAQPPFEQQVLFKASQDPGYACYRIPAVVKTKQGTLLAFAEGRTNDCSDAGDIDIVVKRSEDGGRTWSPLQVVNEGAGDTHGNPAPVVDLRTGRILLAETYNTGRTDGKNCDVPCDRTPHLQYSDDDGRTWSAPRDLSDEILPKDWNSWYATGPVHGIQLTQGRHRGGSSSPSTPRPGTAVASPRTTPRSWSATTAAGTGGSARRTPGRSRTTAPSGRSRPR